MACTSEAAIRNALMRQAWKNWMRALKRRPEGAPEPTPEEAFEAGYLAGHEDRLPQ